MPSGEFLTSIAVFVLTVASSAAVYAAFARSSRPMRRRVRDLELKIKMSEGTYVPPVELGVAGVVDWLKRKLPTPRLDKPAVEKMVHTLQHAGYYNPATVRIFMLIRLALAMAGGLLGCVFALLSNHTELGVLLWMAALACIGYLLPLYRIRSVARWHQISIRHEIPDAIDLMVVCLECGLSLNAAIRMIGSEFERHGRLLGAQMAMMSAELASGRSLSEGFRAIALRSGVEEIRPVAAIVGQSEKLGSEMSQALRATAEQLRAQRSTRAEEAAQKLPIKMIIPLITFLLPTMILIVAGPVAIQMFRAFHQLYVSR
jgi:tight adherence protein C